MSEPLVIVSVTGTGIGTPACFSSALAFATSRAGTFRSWKKNGELGGLASTVGVYMPE